MIQENVKSITQYSRNKLPNPRFLILLLLTELKAILKAVDVNNLANYQRPMMDEFTELNNSPCQEELIQTNNGKPVNLLVF